MKLLPPTVEIPADNPYQNDLFNRQEFGNSLSSLFESIQDGVVVCVDAPWGEGKSTFARMWTADLLNRGKHCIYFDAYAHDYANDPFIHFCGEIVSLAEESFKDSPAIETLKEDFQSKAKRLGGELLSTATRIGVKAATLGIIKDTDLDSLDSIREGVADSSSSLASQAVGKAIEEYAQAKNTLHEFREQLATLGKAVREEQGFPLLVVVDELDRCRPDYALTLIERIKHLFSTANVSFLLLTNTAQLENYVMTVYGQKVDAVNYLQKFFSLYTNLPQNRVDSSDNDYKKYTQKLIDHYDIQKKSGEDIHKYLTAFFNYYNFSLREMERVAVNLSVYYAQLPEGRITDSFLISLLACIKFRFPDVFTKLQNGEISAQELFNTTKVDTIPNLDYIRHSTIWANRALSFFLTPEEEFDKLDAEHPVKNFVSPFSLHLGRLETISFFCDELSKFKVKSE